MGLSLPCIARIVKQRRLPMMLDRFFQLHRSFAVQELRCDDGFLRN